VRLPVRHALELAPTAPFAFDATFHKPDHFPSSDNAWEPGVRSQTMRWRGRLLGLRLEDAGSVDDPRVLATVWAERQLAPGLLAELANELVYRYNLLLDLGDFERRFARDEHLGPVLERWRGMRPMHPGSLYEYLVIAIVLQNATVRRSVQMLEALFDYYGERVCFDAASLSVFWKPKALAAAREDDLRALKVGYRAVSLRRVSAAVALGEVDEHRLRSAPLEEQRRALLGLYGVGPASVGYILVDVFHRLDELSHVSPWEQKIYSRLLFGTDPDRPVPVRRLLELFEERFAGYRALAVHYLWEDLFWRWKTEGVDWLDRLIRG
jgi:3-methyladenine DNA glycosylase/8-oxoguanine DNA glycosylase